MFLRSTRRSFQRRFQLSQSLQNLHISNWHESEIIVDRKSKFQARHTDIQHPDDIPQVLNQFISQHKSIIKNASHPHILAWRTGQLQNHEYINVQQGSKDNGERGAGGILLEHMAKNNVMNKVVIVSRWYGGNPIGSLRFRHISNCAFASLRKASPK